MSRNVALIRSLEHAKKKALDFAGRDMLQTRALEHFQANQPPVRVKKMRQIKS